MRKKIFTLPLPVLTALCFVIPFVVFLIVGRQDPKTYYVLDWTTRNYYLGIWLIALVAIIKNKKQIALFSSIGNVSGIVLGQLLGDVILKMNLAKITSAMTAEEQARLHLHWGWLIWIIVVILSIIAGYLAERRKAQNH